MKIAPFRREHAEMIDLQANQQEPDAARAEILETMDSFTGIVGDKVMFCVGRAKQWQGRWIVWALLSKDAGPHMLHITRAVRRILALAKGDGRVELIVKSEFAAAHRWAKILGFAHHHHEERFLPDGTDADIYVRFM